MSDTSTKSIVIFPVEGIGEVSPGDDLASMITGQVALNQGDVVVVTQKIVSKSEGRIVDCDPNDPAAKEKIVTDEAVRVLRRRGDLLITETRHGFVCANSGVDLSNIAEGKAVLLPVDSDRSARRIKDSIGNLAGVEVGVIVSDTFGRTWRRGVTDVAIGCAGIAGVVDLRGTLDGSGRELVATEVAVADELAAAAELVMGKASGFPVAVIRGVNPEWLRKSSVVGEIVRNPGEDLFR